MEDHSPFLQLVVTGLHRVGRWDSKSRACRNADEPFQLEVVCAHFRVKVHVSHRVFFVFHGFLVSRESNPVISVRVYEFPSASSSFDDALDVVDGTRECHDAKCKQWFSNEVLVNERLATCRFAGSSSAVVGGISDVSSVPDDDDVLVDEGSTVSNSTQDSGINLGLRAARGRC